MLRSKVLFVLSLTFKHVGWYAVSVFDKQEPEQEQEPQSQDQEQKPKHKEQQRQQQQQQIQQQQQQQKQQQKQKQNKRIKQQKQRLTGFVSPPSRAEKGVQGKTTTRTKTKTIIFANSWKTWCFPTRFCHEPPSILYACMILVSME